MGISAVTMWRLWKGLKNPASDHPVFVRVMDDSYDDATRMSRLAQNIFLQGQVWLWPLLFIIDMRLVCLMALSGTFSGAILTLRISSRITSEQQSRTFDLLCMTPGGTIRTLWAICTGCLHREQAFEILNSLEAWIVRFGLFVPFIISSQLFLQRVLGMQGRRDTHMGSRIYRAVLYRPYPSDGVWLFIRHVSGTAHIKYGSTAVGSGNVRGISSVFVSFYDYGWPVYPAGCFPLADDHRYQQRNQPDGADGSDFLRDA